MNNTFAVVTGHYIIINRQERINLKNKKGRVLNESKDRIYLEIDGNEYSLPISTVRKYDNFKSQKVYRLLK